MEIHVAGNVKVHSCSVSDPRIVVHADGGWPDEVGGDAKVLGLVDEDVRDPEQLGGLGVQGHVVKGAQLLGNPDSSVKISVADWLRGYE